MSFPQKMDELFLLHDATLELGHAIRSSGSKDKWKPFVASKFVYSYFIFNSLYAIDWEESVGTEKWIDWETKRQNARQAGQSPGRRTEEPEKIQEMLTFIKKFIGINNFNASLPKYIKKYLEEFDMDVEAAGQNLEHIPLRSQIDAKMKRKYGEFCGIDRIKEFFSDVMEKQDISDPLDKMLFFVYHVRNNVFHGTKRTLLIAEERQNKRLEIYTAVLFAVNDLLFEAVEEATKEKSISWKRGWILRGQQEA